LLDYQSRTSVNLAKILLKEYWQKEVVLEDAKEDFRSAIKGTTAGIVIGDRALEQRKISPISMILVLPGKRLYRTAFCICGLGGQ
jgi:chorismate dehydratase